MDSLLSQFPPEAIEALVDKAFEGVAIAENGQMLYVNQGLAAIFGYSVRELIGMYTYDLAAPDSFLPVKESTLSAEEREYWATGLRKDGRYFTAHLRSIPFHWQGRLLRLTAIRDATVSRAEEQLKETNQMFEATFEQAAVGVGHTSPQGNWLRVNRRFGELLGYLPEDLVGRSFQELLHADDLPACMELFKKLLSGVIRSCAPEIRYLRRDGSYLWCQVTVSGVYALDGQLKYFVEITQEITERKNAEERLLDYRLRMFASSKMSALGEMAGGLAHEINNPLAIIRSYVGVLREGIQGGLVPKQELLSSLEKIDATAMRITQIVRSLKGFVRDSESDTFQSVRMGALISDALSLCESRLRANHIDFELAEFSSELRLDCQVVPISQVLLNLINNAVDAVSGCEKKWIRIGVRDLNDQVELTVEDSGPGVPAEVRERIMQPFFTTKPDGQGTGLGLSISKKIVESHSGSLRLDADAETTRFVLRLPKWHAPHQ